MATPPKKGAPGIHPVPIPEPAALDPRSIVDSFANQMTYAVVKDEHTASLEDVYRGLARSVRNRLSERWFRTQEAYYWTDVKRVYYLSLEFLIGRLLLSNVRNLGAYDDYAEAMERLGYDIEALQEHEQDAALGNGGLGRLAACYLESAASIGLPFYGYGIRYEYGIFRQHIVDGEQREAPDNWLRFGNPWELPRPHATFPVHFHGRADFVSHADGSFTAEWRDTETIHAMAYDTMVLGYRNNVVNALRLWSAKAIEEFDIDSFNAGEYVRAVEQKTASENISKVLYPPDDRSIGKELRLKQEYFFVSATLQDVLRRFRKRERSWSELPQKVAIQLNDTHPAVAIPELMRLLVDEHRIPWEEAWTLTRDTFTFTNHTVMPEALETWSTDLFGRLLPRHLQIVEEIDRRLRRRCRQAGFGDEKTHAAAIVDERSSRVRMANLAVEGSHKVNGVAEMHSRIVRESLFPALHELDPSKFTNITNGITPRRWLLQANRPLAALITEAIGVGWAADLDELQRLEPLAEDPVFRGRWAEARNASKRRLANWLATHYGVEIDAATMFDVHVKRIHEYKRQLLTVMHALHLYARLMDGEAFDAPRTILFAGKAAPGYQAAKAILALIHDVARLVDEEPRARRLLRVVFIHDYGVTHAERIFPATDLSEQVSTAGTEASGTGNMKAVLNGALIAGTRDGANIEIFEAVGEDLMFPFGLTAAEVEQVRERRVAPAEWIRADSRLSRVVEIIAAISRSRGGRFGALHASLTETDTYLHCADFASYVQAQERASDLWGDAEEWTRRSILACSRMGRFSSDRSVREYARHLWDARSVHEALASLAGNSRV